MYDTWGVESLSIIGTSKASNVGEFANIDYWDVEGMLYRKLPYSSYDYVLSSLFSIFLELKYAMEKHQNLNIIKFMMIVIHVI